MNKKILSLLIIFSGVFIIKILLTPAIIYEYDLYSFSAWALAIGKEGIVNSYNVSIIPELSKVNYPPGSMYFFAFLGWLATTFKITGLFWLGLLKLPAILFDLAAAAVIYLIFRKKYSFKKALWPCLLYLLNPMVWLNSSLWGATDSWPVFFTLLSIYFLSEKKYILTGILLAISIMLKPQALIFIPLIGVFLILQEGWIKAIKAGLASLGTIVFICLPWLITGKWQQVWEVMTGYLGYYTRLSSFAFNLWYLFYGYLSVLMNDQDKILSWLNFRQLGLGIFLLIYLLIIGLLVYWRVKNKKFFEKEKFWLIFTGAIIIGQSFFLFCTEIHERYLFQILPLILMLYYKQKEAKYFYLFFTISIFMNTFFSILIPFLHANQINMQYPDLVFRSMAGINLIVFGLFIFYSSKYITSSLKQKN